MSLGGLRGLGQPAAPEGTPSRLSLHNLGAQLGTGQEMRAGILPFGLSSASIIGNADK